MVHQRKKCEACKQFESQWLLKDILGKGKYKDKDYMVCSNCLQNLVNENLKPKQYKNLLKSSHKEDEFLLHSDFYDEHGHALQPKC
jgi:hypothetical protein